MSCLQLLMRPLAFAEEVRVFHRDGCLGCDAADDQLVAMREHARRGMAEEQAAVHFAFACNDRHGEIAADRQVALGHAVIRRGLAVVGMREHVVDPHDAFAAERRTEQRGRARHRKVRERLAWRARQRVEHERVAIGLRDVVEERAELRAGELNCRVRDSLHHTFQIELARQRRAGPVQDLPLFRLAAQVTFHRPLRRHVAHRGARTDELAVDEQRTGVDHHVLGRAVLAAHLHVLVAQRLAGLDAIEQRSRLARLHDEVRDRPADELPGRVAEHVELRPVRPDDPAVGVDLVQADDGVLEKIRQLHLALGELALEDLASLQLALQALHASFEVRRQTRTVARVADRLRIRLVERGVAMDSADTADELAVAVAQLADVVAAQQGERLGDAELVPQAFEPQRGALRAAFPEQPDHFAERADRAPARVRLLDQAADLDPEQVRLRPAIREDLPEHLASFDGDVLSAALAWLLRRCRSPPAAGPARRGARA